MRYQELPITPELDEMQTLGLVWYRYANDGPEGWIHDRTSAVPSVWEQQRPGEYLYAVLLED